MFKRFGCPNCLRVPSSLDLSPEIDLMHLPQPDGDQISHEFRAWGVIMVP